MKLINKTIIVIMVITVPLRAMADGGSILAGLGLVTGLWHLSQSHNEPEYNRRVTYSTVQHLSRPTYTARRIYDRRKGINELIDYDVVLNTPRKRAGDETRVKTTSVETCTDSGDCKTIVTVVTDRLKTEFFR